MVDVFVGSFQVETRDNYDGFMQAVGIPAEYIEAGRNATVITEIATSGDVVSITRKRPKRTATNSFKLGQETEIDTVKGDKAKVTVNVDGGKLVASGSEYNFIMELVGGKLKETITVKGNTMTRISARQ